MTVVDFSYPKGEMEMGKIAKPLEAFDALRGQMVESGGKLSPVEYATAVLQEAEFLAKMMRGHLPGCAVEEFAKAVTMMMSEVESNRGV